ncbi:MAG: RtcB family protein [Trueperaceae bacterium]|nr:RtcB family protein [Trueperaceae bacterium]
MASSLPIEHVGGVTYRVPRFGAMRVDAVFYASPEIMDDLAREEYASLWQLVNVAALPGIVAPALAMPDIHMGYGFPIGGVAAFDPDAGGVVSPGGVGYDINCGVRLLRSELSIEDVQQRQEALADALWAAVPAGVGSGVASQRLQRRDLRRVLEQGAAWMVEHGFGEGEDLDDLESGGRLDGADPDAVSERAMERGAPQLGSLGSGNHFLEVQAVDAVYDQEAAAALGLREGEVTVLIHTGSRGLGHQVCSDHVGTFLKAASRHGIDLPDKQLAAAPIDSDEGRGYLGAMAAAANYAFANRQHVTDSVRRTFERVGFLPRDHGLRVVYDLGHNNAKFETHDGRRVLVHRKGATRAFGPGHPSLSERHRATGQPVFVPGDMGRYSFVLAGTEEAMQASFGSSCHGAGRLMSRRRAKKEAKTRRIDDELAARGILVRAANRATLAEEMSDAYKDVADVVDVVERAGLGRKVARLRPMIVVKG